MIDRRKLLIGGASVAIAPTLSLGAASGYSKTIPSTGEAVPALGMGSWLTFDVGTDIAARSFRIEVLRAFFEAGGRLIDSSPMYGSSQQVIGACLKSLNRRHDVLSADKVWTPGGENGPAQIERSRIDWGVDRFDLLQIHNLVDWRRHLETLKQMKADGHVRYIGVTTYAGLKHLELEQILISQPVDFVQLTYNIADRAAESRLLPLASDRGIAVIANRPFREGALFERIKGQALPALAAEVGAKSWAQFMLKFVISHPALTCAIPATRRVDHMIENMGALTGPVPDALMRRKMADAFANI